MGPYDRRGSRNPGSWLPPLLALVAPIPMRALLETEEEKVGGRTGRAHDAVVGSAVGTGEQLHGLSQAHACVDMDRFVRSLQVGPQGRAVVPGSYLIGRMFVCSIRKVQVQYGDRKSVV